MQSAGGDRRAVGSLEKAFRVLEAFGSDGRAVGLTELARLSGVERSAAQRVLYTLREMGYLRQDPATRLYTLSPRFLRFGTASVQGHRVRELAAPVLSALADRCEETVNLTELQGSNVIYVLRYPSRHAVSVNLSLGSSLPAYCTAPGRAILSHRTAVEVDEVLRADPLEKRTDFTETDPESVRAILARVRGEGFCLSDQEAFVGDISIAAPVLDRHEMAIAAVNIAVPSPRWSVQRVQRELAPLVRESAGQISRLLQ